MQPAVGAAFVVIQAEALLEFAVVVLDAPAELREPNERHERRVGGQVREPVLDRLVLALGPFGEQPALREHAVVLALGVVGGTDADRDELAGQRAAVTFAPADRVDVLAAGGERQRPQA